MHADDEAYVKQVEERIDAGDMDLGEALATVRKLVAGLKLCDERNLKMEQAVAAFHKQFIVWIMRQSEGVKFETALFCWVKYMAMLDAAGFKEESEGEEGA
jgi:hypothetical protein